MTFKKEMQDLAYELIVTDPDFSTVSVECIHRQPTFQTYDEEYGDIFEHNSDSVITAMIGPFNEVKFNAHDILVGDLKLVTPTIGLTQEFQVSVDYILLQDGTEYTIVDKTLDAADTVYTLLLRKDNGKT